MRSGVFCLLEGLFLCPRVCSCICKLRRTVSLEICNFVYVPVFAEVGCTLAALRWAS